MALEMGRDAAQDTLDQEESLKPHPLESLCLPEEAKLPLLEHINSEAMTTLLDVYMDDFIGLVQAITKQELIHSHRQFYMEYTLCSHPLAGP